MPKSDWRSWEHNKSGSFKLEKASQRGFIDEPCENIGAVEEPRFKAKRLFIDKDNYKKRNQFAIDITKEPLQNKKLKRRPENEERRTKNEEPKELKETRWRARRVTKKDQELKYEDRNGSFDGKKRNFLEEMKDVEEDTDQEGIRIVLNGKKVHWQTIVMNKNRTDEEDDWKSREGLGEKEEAEQTIDKERIKNKR